MVYAIDHGLWRNIDFRHSLWRNLSGSARPRRRAAARRAPQPDARAQIMSPCTVQCTVHVHCMSAVQYSVPVYTVHPCFLYGPLDSGGWCCVVGDGGTFLLRIRSSPINNPCVPHKSRPSGDDASARRTPVRAAIRCRRGAFPTRRCTPGGNALRALDQKRVRRRRNGQRQRCPFKFQEMFDIANLY